MDTAARQFVRQRADNRCEYCRLRQEHLSLRPLQIEHIVAKKHDGDDTLSNLALACDRCNLHKGSNLSGIDPESGEIVPLFHPRQRVWQEHFTPQGIEILGLTPIGRATVRVLNINAPRRLRLRAILHRQGQLD
jgi:hypothetical protein